MTGFDPTAPPYRRIAGEIRARITAGELRAGDRVPSTRQITQQWGVAKATATKVLDVLRAEGLVRTMPRVGAVVCAPTPEPSSTLRRPANSTHGELNTARITGAALAIADEQGLAAVTMRGVGSALGVPTMSLYRHVSNKDALTDLMVDAAFGEIDYPEMPPEGWRPGLEVAARLHWRVYRAHPWLPSLVSLTHPNVLPNIARYAEWTLRVIRALGLDPQTRMMVHFMLANYVRGTATNLELQAEMDQQTGLSGGEWATTQLTGLGSEGFPQLTEAIAQEPEYRIDLDEQFEFGLERILDGVADLVGTGKGESLTSHRGLRR